MADVFAISLIGGLLSLDNIAIFQVMLSQPIIVATFIGFFLDNLEVGLITGALLQLLWTSNVPAGAVVPPDKSILACMGSSTAILGLQFWSPPVAIFFSLVMILIFAPVTSWADIWIRQLNNHLTLLADVSALKGYLHAVNLKHLSGVLIFFLKGFILILLGTGLSLFLGRRLLQVSAYVSFPASEELTRFADIFDRLFLTVGIGSAVQLLRESGRLANFFIAFFLCLFLVEGLTLPTGISVVVAILVPLIKQRIEIRRET